MVVLAAWNVCSLAQRILYFSQGSETYYYLHKGSIPLPFV